MESLKRELISYGVNGRILSSIPDEILEQAKSSSIAEINRVEDLPLFLQGYLRKDVMNYIDKEIDNAEKFVLRLSGEEWCRAVLNDKTKKGPHYYTLSSLLVTNPNGMSNEDIAMELNTTVDQSRRWLRTLREEGLLKSNISGDKKIYTYNFEALPGTVEPQNVEGAQFLNDDKKSKKKRLGSIRLGSGARDRTGRRACPAEKHNIPEIARELFRAMKKEKLATVRAKDLSKYVKVGEEETNFIVEGLMKEKFIRATEDSEGNELFAPLTLDCVADQLISFGNSRRIFRLNDSRVQIAQIFPMAFDGGDGGIVDLFESNGFSIVEVRSKYLPVDFIIADPSISETDDEFLLMLHEVKMVTSRQFREKIWNTFFRNHDFAAVDNGFSPFVNQRVELFYTFLLKEIKICNYKLLLDQDLLMKMSFPTFISCVRLSGCDTLCIIASECAKRSNKKPFIAEMRKLSELCLEFNSGSYVEILDKSRSYLSKYTCGDVLRLIVRNKSLTENLRPRMFVSEFKELLDLLVQYGLFQMAEENNVFYFRMSEEDKISVESVYDDIEREMGCGEEYRVSMGDRRAFFDAICDCDQEAFRDRAEEYISSLENPDVIRYFSQKLRLFK